jgi:SOR/SNZ family
MRLHLQHYVGCLLLGSCVAALHQARIGHFVEAQILEAIEVDYIDESEVLTMADEDNHINKNKFKVPFVCGCRNLGEALVSFFQKPLHTFSCTVMPYTVVYVQSD